MSGEVMLQGERTVGPTRTCVGCGKRDERSRLVRMVVDRQGEISFDLASRTVGRGAHVHPNAGCLKRAATRGLSRSLRRDLSCGVEQLHAKLLDGVSRQVCGLLASAVRDGKAVHGAPAIEAAAGCGDLAIVVVACDATAAERQTTLEHLISAGRCVAWGTRAHLGALVQHQPIAALGIRDARLGRAIANACRIADGARIGAEVR